MSHDLAMPNFSLILSPKKTKRIRQSHYIPLRSTLVKTSPPNHRSHNVTSQSTRSRSTAKPTVVSQHGPSFGNSSPLISESTTNADAARIWIGESEQAIAREMDCSYRPKIQLFPAIVLPPHVKAGSYQDFYDALLRIEQVMETHVIEFKALFCTSHAPSGDGQARECCSGGERQLVPEHPVGEGSEDLQEDLPEKGRLTNKPYETGLSWIINCVFHLASKTLDLKELGRFKSYHSDEITIDKVVRGDGIVEVKRDGDVYIVDLGANGGAVRKGNGKISFPVTALKSVGECKPKSTPVFQAQGHSQLLTYIRQLVLGDRHRISEQGFTCCNLQFRFFHFDAEGMAMSEPYDISRNLFRFINHVLILSTFFTKDAVWPFGSQNPTSEVQYLSYGRDGIRGRRTTVYVCETTTPPSNTVSVRETTTPPCDAARIVIKEYWPTQTTCETREVRMYSIVRRLGKTHPHLQSMLHYDCHRNTAEIRLSFGVPSIAPREHIVITLDRQGVSLADKMWREGTAKLYSKMSAEKRMCFAKLMLTGILGGIKGE